MASRQEEFQKELKAMQKRKKNGESIAPKPDPKRDKKKELHQMQKIYVQIYGDAWKDYWVKHYWAVLDTETMTASKICLCCLREGRGIPH